jgi:autotransporter-associated beta strand protein
MKFRPTHCLVDQVYVCLAIAILGIALILTGSAQAQEWNVNSNGIWGGKTNWNPQMVPDGLGATAILGAKITAARVITLNQDIAVGNLNIDNANSYTIAARVGLPPKIFAIKNITVTNKNGNGAHVISNPISMIGDNPLSISVDDTNVAGLTLSGAISGSGDLAKSGGGTLVLESGGYKGDTKVMGGTLIARLSGGLPTGTGVTVANGAKLVIRGTNGHTTIGGLVGEGGVTLSGNATTLLRIESSSSSAFAGVISGQGSLDKAGTGVLNLQNKNTYAGSTHVSSGGMLRIGVDNAVPDKTALSLSSGSAFDMSGFNQTVGRLTGSGTVKNDAMDLKTFTVTAPVNNDIFAGQLLGDLNFVKDGANTLILANTNDYEGTTTIKAGTLKLGDIMLPPTTGSLPSGNDVVLENKGALDLKVS